MPKSPGWNAGPGICMGRRFGGPFFRIRPPKLRQSMLGLRLAGRAPVPWAGHSGIGKGLPQSGPKLSSAGCGAARESARPER